MMGGFVVGYNLALDWETMGVFQRACYSRVITRVGGGWIFYWVYPTTWVIVRFSRVFTSIKAVLFKLAYLFAAT